VNDDYPCAGLVGGPVVSVFRALDIAAAPKRVFSWLCQLKIAPYSYDLVDNLGRRSPRTLTPGVDELAVGQKWIMVFRIVSFEADHHITGTTRAGRLGQQACTYRIRPSAGGGSRLVVRLDLSVSSAVRRATAPALAWGDLPMMRKQLLTIRDLAEHSDQNSNGSV
jgi:hypothetical protein